MEDNFGSFFRWCNINGILIGRNGDGPKADFEFALVSESTDHGKTSCEILILNYIDVICDYTQARSIIKTYFNMGGCKL